MISRVFNFIRTLKRIFSLAIEPRGYLMERQNPFRSIKQRKYCRRPVRYVSPQEFRQLRGAARSPWWKTLLTVAYTTGARIGEVLNLTWPDLDFESNRIGIDRKVGEASTAAWQPKDREGRLLPAPPETMQLLANLHAESAEGCPYVFVHPRRWEHLKKTRKTEAALTPNVLVNNLNRNFEVLRKHAGVAKCTLHDLRRSCITNWARCLPAHVVQKLAGHSDIKTTQMYYLSVQEDDLKKVRDVQSAILAGDPTDPLLTHFGQNGAFSGRASENGKS